MNIPKLLMLLCFFSACTLIHAQKKVLIFSKTAGFRHKSIPKGISTVADLLKQAGIGSLHSEDAAYFCADSLSKFDAVIFLSTTGDIFNDQQKEAFQTFIRAGKGFVGIHAATDTEHNWPWYGQLVGGYFASHPAVQEAKITVLDREHASTKHLPQIWWHKDEWYDFKDIKPGMHILMNLDERSYKDGKMGKFHPVAWYQDFEGARMFYTALGHTEEAFDSPDFQRHLLGGIQYVLQVH